MSSYFSYFRCLPGLVAGAFLLIPTVRGTALQVSDGQHLVEEDKGYREVLDVFIATVGKGASYTGKGIDMDLETNASDAPGFGIYAERSLFLALDGFSINLSGSGRDAIAVSLIDVVQQSILSRSVITINGAYKDSNFAVVASASDIAIEDCRFIFEESGLARPDFSRYGVCANEGATMTVRDSSFTYQGDRADSDVVFYTIGESSIFAEGVVVNSSSERMHVVAGAQGGDVTVKDSQINSVRGASLVSCVQSPGDSHGAVRLDGVDLSNAKGQRLLLSTESSSGLGTSTVTMTNGTHFDGRTELESGSNDVAFVKLRVEGCSSWTISGENTGRLLEFSLDGTSCVNFMSLEEGEFANIYSASVLLEQGCILRLDQDASTYVAGDVITLFNNGNLAVVNEGAVLMSRDGYALVYDDLVSANGSFVLTGEMVRVIPEPATTTLGLLSLAAYALRRRK